MLDNKQTLLFGNFKKACFKNFYASNLDGILCDMDPENDKRAFTPKWDAPAQIISI